MGQYSLHLLHSLSNQGYSGLQMSKLGLVTSATYVAMLATWLLGINLICSNLASDQADHQGPWVSCLEAGVRIPPKSDFN